MFGLLWQLSVAAFTVYIFVLGIYRLYFSPLARFPGPKLASLTLWYEFYYDVILSGRYMWEIERMHAVYGPIVRINPYELHINDPEAYDEIYAGAAKRRTNKYPWFVRLYGQHTGILSTIDHDLHRVRRGAFGHFFSKANVRKLETFIQEKTDRVLEIMAQLEKTGKPLRLSSIYSAFTSDVIMEYAFGESHNFLDREDLNARFFEMMGSIHHLGPAAKQFGWLMPLILSIPHWITSSLDKGLAEFAAMQQECKEQVRHIIEHMDEYETRARPTIIHGILQSKLDPAEKEVDRLYEEGQTFITAGTETVAWAITVITFYLLQDPKKLQRLREELFAANVSTVMELERLPYLTAVIHEGLRLSFGASHRLPRISPDAPIHFLDRGNGQNWEIPSGTPVSMSTGLLHLNPETFPEPLEFLPDRWINNKGLERYLVAFSKGSRSCVATNLAWSEIYISLDRLFRRYGAPGQDAPGTMTLYETTQRDVEMHHDLFIPWPAEDSKGVRVVFSSN